MLIRLTKSEVIMDTMTIIEINLVSAWIGPLHTLACKRYEIPGCLRLFDCVPNPLQEGI
jgi:hypothetical protein